MAKSRQQNIQNYSGPEYEERTGNSSKGFILSENDNIFQKNISSILEDGGKINIKGSIPFCVSQYLESKHNTLKNNYRMPDGQFSDSCFYIASELSHLFVDSGKLPEIIVFQKDNSPIKPKVYEKLEWGAHVVCCCEGIVFDPMLNTPVLLSEYSILAFGEEITPKTKVGKNEIIKFINRWANL